MFFSLVLDRIYTTAVFDTNVTDFLIITNRDMDVEITSERLSGFGKGQR